MTTRSLALRKDTLAELTPAELSGVGAAAPASTPTLTCSALIRATTQVVGTLLTGMYPTLDCA